MTDRTLDACADSLLECRREVLALRADLALCYDVCGEAISSEYRNVGVVEACAARLEAVRADLAAERAEHERHKRKLVNIIDDLHGCSEDRGRYRTEIRTLEADLNAVRAERDEARGMYGRLEAEMRRRIYERIERYTHENEELRKHIDKIMQPLFREKMMQPGPPIVVDGASAAQVRTLKAALAAEREARERAEGAWIAARNVALQELSFTEFQRERAERAEAALREIRDRHASIEPTTCFECEATLVRSTLALEER